jgi:hypothetical protein
MLVRYRISRLVQHLAVATVSLLVMGAAAIYALAPESEAIGATVRAVASSGHSAVEGRILNGKSAARGVSVEVLGNVRFRRHGRWVTRAEPVGIATTGRTGRFSIRVRPGKYFVVVEDGSKAKLRLTVTVRRGKSVFVLGKITKRAGGLAIVPVLFNY